MSLEKAPRVVRTPGPASRAPAPARRPARARLTRVIVDPVGLAGVLAAYLVVMRALEVLERYLSLRYGGAP